MGGYMDTRPNILMVQVDQFRADCFGAAGNTVIQTPNLDKLSRESTRFERAYCPSPVCGPSRGAVFSGSYPPGSGVVKNWMPFREGTELFPRRLRKLGYETLNVGKLHFVPQSSDWGFNRNILHDAPYDVYDNDAQYSYYMKWLNEQVPDCDFLSKFNQDELEYPDGNLRQFIMGGNFLSEDLHYTPWTSREAVKLLENRDISKPFFLHVSFFSPHQPWDVPAPWNKMYRDADIPLPHLEKDALSAPIFQKMKLDIQNRLKSQLSSRDLKDIIRGYYQNISMIDHYIGLLFNYLRDNSLWDNTCIIFFADHGEYAGQYNLFFKGDMYEPPVRVPLLIKQPGKRPPAVYSKPVSTLDLYGTVLETAGLAQWQTERTEGMSLNRVLDGKDYEGERSVFSIIGADRERVLTMLCQGGRKLIRLGCGKDSPLYEFYNLEEDPLELQNNYPALESSAAVRAMKEELDSWTALQSGRYPG